MFDPASLLDYADTEHDVALTITCLRQFKIVCHLPQGTWAGDRITLCTHWTILRAMQTVRMLLNLQIEKRLSMQCAVIKSR